MAAKFKIKKGDNVVVLSGKDKGRSGEVRQVISKERRVLVSGINMVKRHTKPTAQSEGGVIAKESPLHISNVSLVDPGDGKPTRIRYEFQDGAKVRVSVRSGSVIS